MCTCVQAWSSVLPPDPCPVHTQRVWAIPPQADQFNWWVVGTPYAPDNDSVYRKVTP